MQILKSLQGQFISNEISSFVSTSCLKLSRPLGTHYIDTESRGKIANVLLKLLEHEADSKWEFGACMHIPYMDTCHRHVLATHRMLT